MLSAPLLSLERASLQSISRVICRFRSPKPGPTLVVIAGLHGNEPSGVEAVRRVAAEFDATLLRGGELVGLIGNRGALEKGVRYVERDLNRGWTPAEMARLRGATDSELAAEDLEQRELHAELLKVIKEARGEVFCLDLHTTSSESPPFALFSDTIRNRRFAMSFPVPWILGLEEQIEGPLLDYFGNLGAVTVGFEAGQHDAPQSIELHEGAVWLALESSGLVTGQAVHDFDEKRSSLERAASGLPAVVEVLHRHPVTEADEFVSVPGLLNLQPVSKGQVLATDRRGPIRAGVAGRVLMPLYQRLGSDGFFLVRDVSRFWLSLSALLRKLRLESLLVWLPGVQGRPGREGQLIVDTRVARFLTREVFHLLGYRRRRIDGNKVIMTRRLYDLNSPFPGS